MIRVGEVFRGEWGSLVCGRASVMQAGRWKDTRMPMRYGEVAVSSWRLIHNGIPRAGAMQRF
jgi:hypothetical protein